MISPYVRRLRLADELRRLRDHAGLSSEELARRSGVNRQMISKLENAHVPPRPSHVMELLKALSVSGRHWEELMQIANEAASRGWWESAKQIGERQAIFANLEAGARRIREYQKTLVPGLLQVPEYTRARIAASALGLPEGVDVEGVLFGRARRQEMLFRSGGPGYEVILDEIVLRRRSAPSHVFAAQLRDIVRRTDEERVDVLVLPIEAQIRGFDIPESSFSLFTYPDPKDPPIVAIEAVTTDLMLTGTAEVAGYETVYAGLLEASLAPDKSRDMLHHLVRTLPDD